MAITKLILGVRLLQLHKRYRPCRRCGSVRFGLLSMNSTKHIITAFGNSFTFCLFLVHNCFFSSRFIIIFHGINISCLLLMLLLLYSAASHRHCVCMYVSYMYRFTYIASQHCCAPHWRARFLACACAALALLLLLALLLYF